MSCSESAGVNYRERLLAKIRPERTGSLLTRPSCGAMDATMALDWKHRWGLANRRFCSGWNAQLLLRRKACERGAGPNEMMP
jgi:hypothetical protein